ncbi:transcriptional regulator [Christiangramia fulva]|uniref:Transcriptional regulator n=1 Tax=Christiangramia fulva TaxID=2126553 RepID=A0A2R3Z278_9FLAO|nr:DeoR/GlpR family DNA-binding transcription regulator [Christiangramia fulva]AVR44342.1 transcriptional regulator [Christiangramia fulva]
MLRHQQILEKLKKDKYIEVQDLCEILDVSAVTIRKDLRLLEQKGLLFRTHGGASLENPYIAEKPVIEKEKLYTEEKSRIATKAASLIQPNDTIIIGSGTTVQNLAKAIVPKEKLSVITSSLYVALELTKYEEIEIIQLGGPLRHSSASVTGYYAEEILKNITCHQLFLGVDAIDTENGCTTTSLEEAILNRKMIKAAQKVIILADSTKFGKRSLGKICDLDQVHEIITDDKISSKTLKRLKDSGVKVSIA